MQRVTPRFLVIACMVLAMGATAHAFQPTGRQCYGPWQPSVNPGCYYRIYYSKRTPSSSSYSKQRVYYYTAHPAWLYYYNPTSGKFWCRCPTTKNPDPTCHQKAMTSTEWWSVLDQGDCSPDLDNCIDDFPPASDDDCPVVPGSQDGKLMAMPPADLPETD